MTKHAKIPAPLEQFPGGPHWATVIDQLRVLRGWRVCDLVKKCGVTHDHLTRILAGESPNVGIRTLTKICAALGCSLDYALHAKDVALDDADDSVKAACGYEKKKLRWWQIVTWFARRTKHLILGCFEHVRRQGIGLWRGR